MSTFRSAALLYRGTHAPRTRILSKDLRQSFVSNIANRYGDRLRRFLSRRLRNVSDAPDLAQEVFLRLLRVEHHALESERILPVPEHFQCLFNLIILHEQLHASRSPFHAGAHADNDRRYAGSIQRDPRDISFNSRRIVFDGFHRQP
jgi:hypothetical protein